ncbi:Uncharacterised protein [Mycobacterium tuberculosis]|nr:Uncharacterised protein [Mycobacterium tuberculosis]
MVAVVTVNSSGAPEAMEATLGCLATGARVAPAVKVKRLGAPEATEATPG